VSAEDFSQTRTPGSRLRPFPNSVWAGRNLRERHPTKCRADKAERRSDFATETWYVDQAVSVPRFPAIAICPSDSFHVAESLESLTVVSSHALGSGYFTRLYLFDSDGSCWRIARVERTAAHVAGPFGKLVSVNLSFSAPEPATLADIAEDLCRVVDADPDDVYNQFVSHDELQRMFRSAVTPSELLTAASSLGGQDQRSAMGAAISTEPEC
jgi:hypothetical protein